MLGALDLPHFPLCPQRMRPSHSAEWVGELWAVQYPRVWSAVTGSATSAPTPVSLTRCHPYLSKEDREISVRVVATQAKLCSNECPVSIGTD